MNMAGFLRSGHSYHLHHITITCFSTRQNGYLHRFSISSQYFSTNGQNNVGDTSTNEQPCEQNTDSALVAMQKSLSLPNSIQTDVSRQPLISICQCSSNSEHSTHCYYPLSDHQSSSSAPNVPIGTSIPYICKRRTCDMSDTSSHSNECYLSTPEKKAKMSKLKQRVRVAEKQVQNLRAKI